MRGRSLVLFWAFFAVSSLLLARLYQVQLKDGAGLAAKASEEQEATFTVNPTRGDIVDRFGTVFATTLPSYYIAVRPHEVTQPRSEAERLAPLLGQRAQDVEDAMRSAQPFLYLARNQTKSLYQAVEGLALPGIEADTEPMGRRVAPQAEVGSTVIGFTGVDDQGLAGIEYQFNGELAGHAGSVTEETDAAVRPIPFGRRVVDPAQQGDTVVLTLDRTLQFDADEILRATVARYHAQGGSIVVMRARTGEILALANAPDFDPNHFDRTPASSWRDQAITDPYEPGSTFKLVMATAALDSGKVSLDDTFPALDELHVGGRIIHNADDGLMASGHANETVDDIVTFSHNVGAAEVALRLGKQTMFEYIQRYGFDDTTGVDLPGESAGIVGTPDDWWGSRLATIGFGQGVSVTPLALARAYAAVADGGELMRPLLVRYLVSPDGRILRSYEPQAVRRVMSPQTAVSLLNILRDVVRRGTAKGLSLPGYALAGKTGTAQMVIDGTYVPGAYTASFVGIVPADKPQYVILVKIDRPEGEYYGSIVAAPAFLALARKVLWREGVLPKATTTVLEGQPSSAARSAAGDAAGETRNQL
ncbi:MAG TPA: penicillin-binding protein 2 [Candidatus Acidoferrales bacterium]|nr:penicillin-binding protein 2 [Candidatus Acidoferrales bacterium]